MVEYPDCQLDWTRMNVETALIQSAELPRGMLNRRRRSRQMKMKILGDSMHTMQKDDETKLA